MYIPHKVVEEQQVHSSEMRLTLHILEVNQLNIANYCVVQEEPKHAHETISTL